jgi:hypothetical protein
MCKLSEGGSIETCKMTGGKQWADCGIWVRRELPCLGYRGSWGVYVTDEDRVLDGQESNRLQSLDDCECEHKDPKRESVDWRTSEGRRIAKKKRVAKPAWFMTSSSPIQYASNIIYCTEIGKEWNQVCKLGVMGVVEPWRYGDSIVGMEDIWSRRVVQNDSVSNRTAELWQVLESCNWWMTSKVTIRQTLT